MVSSVQHLRDRLGLDLNSASGPGIGAPAPLLPANPFRYKQAIYDAVVGMEGPQRTPLEALDNEPARLGSAELLRLRQTVQALAERRDLPEAHKNRFHSIGHVASSYADLVEGHKARLAKQPGDENARHTLIRGDSGRIYAMTNSMTGAERERFRQGASSLVPAVEKARLQMKDGQVVHKIELGAGTFGIVRVARDITSGQYVAVKKCHPKLVASVQHGFIAKDPLPSAFWTLPEEDRRTFRDADGVVIAPYDLCILTSKSARAVNHYANHLQKTGRRTMTGELPAFLTEPMVQKALLPLSHRDQIRFIERLHAGTFEPHENEAKTLYTFYELGITTVGDLIEKFNVMRLCTQSALAAAALTDAARSVVLQYRFGYAQAADVAEGDRLDETNAADLSPANPRPVTADPNGAAPPAQSSPVTESLLETQTDGVLHHERFLQTLAHKLLSALQQLHDVHGFSHRDIKPDNIVLVRDCHGQFSVKLIDLDFMHPEPAPAALATHGTLCFMPPEAFLRADDGSITYNGRKSDVYAMGLTLRKAIGFGELELYAVSQKQKIDCLVAHGVRLETAARAFCRRGEASAIVADLQRSVGAADNCIEPSAAIRALVERTPGALTLKSVTDLMLQAQPEQRAAPGSLLQLPLFDTDNPDQLLSDVEFLECTVRIIQDGMTLDEHATRQLNGKLSADMRYLPAMRHVASWAIQRRHAASATAAGQITEPESSIGDGLTGRAQAGRLAGPPASASTR